MWTMWTMWSRFYILYLMAWQRGWLEHFYQVQLVWAFTGQFKLIINISGWTCRFKLCSFWAKSFLPPRCWNPWWSKGSTLPCFMSVWCSLCIVFFVSLSILVLTLFTPDVERGIEILWGDVKLCKQVSVVVIIIIIITIQIKTFAITILIQRGLGRMGPTVPRILVWWPGPLYWWSSSTLQILNHHQYT